MTSNPPSPPRGRGTKKAGPRQRPPIDFIEIETDERRDDDDHENFLVALIEKKDWKGVKSHIETPVGVSEARQPLACRDYALHALCKCCGNDLRPDGSVSGTTRSSGTITTGMDESVFPPRSILKAVMAACPQAVTSTGAAGALPLHNAVRHNYPSGLLGILIRMHPHALDAKDGGMRTPRDYAPVMDDTRVRSFLLRPTSCWLQQMHDEKKHQELEQELQKLQTQVSDLLASLADAKAEERALEERITSIQDEIDSFGDLHQLLEFTKRAERIQEDVQQDTEVIRAKMEGLVGQLMMKYADEEKERAFLASFNEDVIQVYENANAGMQEMRDDLNKIKTNLLTPTP